MIRFIARNITTAVKLPFAMVWDVISLGNMGEGASTGKVVDEHRRQARADRALDDIEEIRKALGK